MKKILDRKDFPQWLNPILQEKGINVKTICAKIGTEFKGVGVPVYDYQSIVLIAYNEETGETKAQRGCNYENYINSTPEERGVYNGLTVKLQPKQFLVEISNIAFRTSVTVYSHPSSVTKSLEEDVTLSKAEYCVLIATRSYKSSYAGISNYRFHEAKRTTGINIDQWEYAKNKLIAKGFLNKRGAITTAGRNVATHDKYPNLYSLVL